MATAKKTTKSKTKKTSSKKGASKKSKGGAIDDLFGGGVSKKKASKAKAKKDIAEFPDELKPFCDVFVSAKVVSKAMESNEALAKKEISEYVLKQWVSKFVETGVQPPTCTYHGKDTQFDHIQTKRIDMKHEKIVALQMIGFDPMEEDEDGDKVHVSLKGMYLNLAKVREHDPDLQDKIKEALAGVIPPDLLAEVLTPTVEFKDNFLAGIVTRARDSLGKKPSKAAIKDRVMAMMKILRPRPSTRSATSSASDSECFSLVSEYGEE
jgi:hypothetical protein